ncbi:DUF6415 family natural product biosynthesis protein [Actinacidiphila rubida]|uniref:Uncharacterized protein n=1 Tax=Actinacidiphila rubida TaxID=310780 RepID=A0A1H8UHA4_9ACTN|nr:DUF6415 family natural product biosynthesis protein [Actinacidiphila rubida]SEP02599.1 hypothetical protein SAMN05216267_107311 [Actinacidiphila rubida]
MTVQTRGPEPQNPTIPRWQPPLDAAGLNDLHGLLLRWAWTAQDSNDLLDEVARALDDVPPPEEEIEDFVERHRGYLMRLVNIAVATRVWYRSVYADTLVQRARVLRAVEMPGDHSQAVLHLRQMGWVAGELVDQLVVLNSIKGAA